MKKKFFSFSMAVLMFCCSGFLLTASATAYCNKCKAITNGNCITATNGHCRTHTRVSGGTAIANCVEPGGAISVCITSGCGASFFANPPLGHSYTNMVCTRSAFCGWLNTNNSSHFRYFMYRAGNHARNISGGWLWHSDHRAIDINNGSGTTSGLPIYAQGPGTARVVAGSSISTAGFYVVIEYDNGYIARYLHVAQTGRVAQGTRVSSNTIIAYTSNTGCPNGNGSGSYNPHLHYDVIHINNVIDKDNFFDLGQTNAHNLIPAALFPRCSCPTGAACSNSAHNNINTFSGQNRSS